MSTVNVRELARDTSKVIDRISRRREPALVTRDGLPVAAIVPIDADALDAWILANAPESVEGVPVLRAESRVHGRPIGRPVSRRRGRSSA
jgi:antitoxin (DNA-binding transcriptional repressor) of toxin-antitoxin stability system